MKKLFLLLAIIALLLVSCEQGGVNEPIDNNQTEQPGNEDENGGNNDENEGNEDENKTFITDAEGNIIVEAEGGEVVVAVATNIDYDVVISEEAQAWLSVADTRGELRMEKLTFTIAENEAEEERSAVVTLLDGENLELQSITFTQKGAIIDTTQAIKFQDENTKLICTLHWDENEDGELSYEEAAKVTDLGTAFKGSSIMAFTELERFTGLEGIADKAFNGCVSLVKITLPEQITSIGSSSFSGCSNLKKITIPDSVTSIGRDAFQGCTGELIVYCNIPSASSSYYGAFYNSKFTKVTIGDSVTSIGDYAFEDCSSLTSVYYNGDLSAWCNIDFYNGASNPLNNGAKLYINNTEVTEVTIPSDISEIKDYAFYGYSSLISITIPESVTTIGEYAFCDCSSLTSITIPESVTSIGNGAFYYCSSLTSVIIPDSVTSIGRHAFDGCTGELIVNCNIPNASSSSSGAFYNSKFTKVTIGDSVTSIGDWAFKDCSSLTSITIPDSVTSIGDYAFSGCDSLTSITIPNSVTTIGDSAFKDCSNLTSITIPNSVTSIGKWAFNDCI